MPPQSLEVVAVSRADGVFLLSDGSVLPVTNWLDEDGDELQDGLSPDAVVAVAGAGALWVTAWLPYFDVSPTVH